MVRYRFVIRVVTCLCCLSAIFFNTRDAGAFWLFSPETGKWTNPKDQAKDTPEQQFDYGKKFFDEAKYDKALEEFKKLTQHYPNTKPAAQAQFFQGTCYEKLNDVVKAGEAYRTLVDRYPYSELVDQSIEREYQLAEAMMDGKKAKLWGMEILPALDMAAELYQHIVKRAPYGPYGAKAQYRLGHALIKQGRLEDAQKAFQAVVDEYPNSPYAVEAKYEIARASYRSSQVEQYHLQKTDEAIQKFEGFSKTYPGSGMAYEANEMISELRKKKAQSMYEIAYFYQQRERYPSARLYYQDIIDQFPDTPTAEQAKLRLAEIKGLKVPPPKNSWQIMSEWPAQSMMAIGKMPGAVMQKMAGNNQVPSTEVKHLSQKHLKADAADMAELPEKKIEAPKKAPAAPQAGSSVGKVPQQQGKNDGGLLGGLGGVANFLTGGIFSQPKPAANAKDVKNV